MGMKLDTITYKGFPVEALKTAFTAVHDPKDWKAPILCNVLGEHVALVCAAIEYYTATEPTVELVMQANRISYTIRAIGYRQGPAGDH